ncbi:MAG: hypothetical protein HZA51_14830 [Planctomycetes bacterium]|nr:hypothetical protein [Planctomycetota bacterium]
MNGACSPISPDSCATLSGVFGGVGTDCDGVTCEPACCPGDLNSNHEINGLDVQGLVDGLLQGAVCA